MSHSPRLFMRPLAVQPTPVPLNVTGTPPKYLPDLQYLTRLPIVGGVGRFKADIVSSNNLPPSAQIYCDNVTKELVIRWPPFKVNPPVMGLVRNGDFSNGLNYWDARTPGWKIGKGQEGTLPDCLEYPGNQLGEGYIDSEQVPCNPGDQINFGCEVQQGASAKGNASGTAALVFIDLAGNETVMRGTVVDDGANREWHPSRLLRAAPAGTYYVKGRLYGNRTRENKSVFFRNVTWDHAYSSGNNGTLPVDITVRVSDSLNTSVTKSYIILPWGAVRHFKGWEVVRDNGTTLPPTAYTLAYDEVSSLFMQTRPGSRSLFTTPDGVTWNEIANFFPFPSSNSATENHMMYNPERQEMVVTGIANSLTGTTPERGYRFTLAGGVLNPTSSTNLPSSAGLAACGAVSVTGSGNTYSMYDGINWTLYSTGILPNWSSSGIMSKRGTNWSRVFISNTSGGGLQSSTIQRVNTTTATIVRAQSPAEGIPASDPQAPASQGVTKQAFSDDLGFGLIVYPSSTTAGAVWQVYGLNDVPQKLTTIERGTVAPVSAGKLFYAPWAGEWVADLNAGQVATPTALVGDMNGLTWSPVVGPTVAFNTSYSTTRKLAISMDREIVLYHCGQYLYRAIFQ